MLNKNDETFGYLSMGDMVGYMPLLKVPGTACHKFDIKGEKEGYIAIIKYEELIVLLKRDPVIVSFLSFANKCIRLFKLLNWQLELV